MAITKGSVQEDTDFTSVYNKIDGVYGRNDDGYGQTLAANPAASGSGKVITAADYVSLRTYVNNSRYHQTGADTTALAVSGQVSAQTLLGTLDTESDNAITNRYTIASGQFTPDEAKASGTRTASWGQQSASNHVLTATCTVTGFDMNGDGQRRGLRYFFNAGGKLKIQLSLATFTGSKSQIWSDLFTNAGTISMNYTQTTCTGTGTTSSIGGLDLTTTNQQIFRKDVGSGVYSENYFTINARFTDANQTAIIFTVKCFDLDTGDDTTPLDPYPNAVDEEVNGTLTFSFSQDRPSGSYVTINSPTYSAVTVTAGTS